MHDAKAWVWCSPCIENMSTFLPVPWLQEMRHPASEFLGNDCGSEVPYPRELYLFLETRPYAVVVTASEVPVLPSRWVLERAGCNGISSPRTTPAANCATLGPCANWYVTWVGSATKHQSSDAVERSCCISGLFCSLMICCSGLPLNAAHKEIGGLSGI